MIKKEYQTSQPTAFRSFVKAASQSLLTGLLFFPTACDSSQAKIKTTCQSHQDCPSEETCTKNNQCEPPGPNSKYLSNCQLRLKNEESNHGRFIVICFWIHPDWQGPYIKLERKNWSQCDPGTTFAPNQGEEVRLKCGFMEVDGDKVPERLQNRGEFCLDKACSPLSMAHFRGEKRVELTNVQGDTLSFDLVPEDPWDGDSSKNDASPDEEASPK